MTAGRGKGDGGRGGEVIPFPQPSRPDGIESEARRELGGKFLVALQHVRNSVSEEAMSAAVCLHDHADVGRNERISIDRWITVILGIEGLLRALRSGAVSNGAT